LSKVSAGEDCLTLPLESLAVLAEQGLLRSHLRQVLLQEALLPEPFNDDDRRQALMAFAQEHGLANADALERFRLSHVLSHGALAFLMELPIRLQRHCERLYRVKAEARFLERKQQLDVVIYSLLRLEDEGLAKELYFQLQDGEANFSDLAALHAQGHERATRGIVGPVPLTQAHPLLVERLRTAPVGEVQEPFLIDRWWVLFRLESLTAASFDEAMARQMSQELFDQWLEQGVQARLDALRPLLLPADPQPQP
jgi:parvulin-like peptidyl-prolyl isomerase